MSEAMVRSSGEVELREVASVSLESAIEGEFNESEVIEGEVLTDILDVSTPICSAATAPRAPVTTAIKTVSHSIAKPCPLIFAQK
jgi:hypothetical protein